MLDVRSGVFQSPPIEIGGYKMLDVICSLKNVLWVMDRGLNLANGLKLFFHLFKQEQPVFYSPKPAHTPPQYPPQFLPN